MGAKKDSSQIRILHQIIDQTLRWLQQITVLLHHLVLIISH
jgi:hypothetical protein